MSVADRTAVLDTSVAVGWFAQQDAQSLAALRVRAEVRDNPDRFVVPPLFHAELVHVLTRKSERDEEAVRAALRIILRLGIRTQALSEGALLRTAHWSCAGLGGYDATFVALAEDLNGCWLTADGRAARVVGPELAVTLTDWAIR